MLKSKKCIQGIGPYSARELVSLFVYNSFFFFLLTEQKKSSTELRKTHMSLSSDAGFMLGKAAVLQGGWNANETRRLFA